MSTFLKIVLRGVWEEKGISKVDFLPTRFSFSLAEKPKRKAPIYHAAARETTKSQVKFDKVKLNSQSHPLDNLAKLKSVNISCEDYGCRSVPSDKAEAVKSKELLMEQLKDCLLYTSPSPRDA